MIATTFDQLIANHADMLARIDDRDSLDGITPAEFIDLIDEIGTAFATSFVNDLQATSRHFGSVYALLTEALGLPDTDTTKARLIAAADKHLHDVDALALA